MSGLEFKPIHKFFRATTSSIKHTKNTRIQKNHQKILITSGLLGYRKINATVYPTEERAFRLNNILN